MPGVNVKLFQAGSLLQTRAQRRNLNPPPVTQPFLPDTHHQKFPHSFASAGIHFQFPNHVLFVTMDETVICNRLISFTNFNAQFLYSLTICMLYYNPRQHLVSSLSVQYSTVCRMRADCSAVCSHPAYCTAIYRERRYQMLWYTICPPEDGHVNARNTSRIVT